MGTDKRERQKAGRQARLEEALAAQRRAQRRRRIIGALAAVAAVVVGGLLISILGAEDDETVETDAPDEEADPADETGPGEGAAVTGETPCPPADGSAERTTSFEQPPPMCIDPEASYTATFTTSEGDVTVALDTERTPNTTNNFVVLARYGYYDDTTLFRTNTSLDIIQGGAPAGPGSSPGYNIEDEGGEFDFDDPASPGGTGPFSYEAGQLIMARGRGPESSSAQFFFSAGPNVTNLDSQGTYLLFGQVTEGLDVLEAILATHQGGPGDPTEGAPAEPVIVEEVTITEA